MTAEIYREARRIELRDQVVTEARTWLKTPWHHAARMKGAGVDCAYFLVRTFAAAGLIPDLKLGYYPPDWHLHQDRPRFLEVLAKYADPLERDPLPGDVAMFKFGRHAAHGSIVVKWPLVIHAYMTERAVVLSDVERNPDLVERLDGFWRLKELA